MVLAREKLVRAGPVFKTWPWGAIETKKNTGEGLDLIH